MKLIFLTFGNEYYYNSLDRIRKEVESFNIFNDILIYNDKNLKEDTTFWEKHKYFIENNHRGYGYWIWKSYLTLKTLNNINENDIIIYTDAGCAFNLNGIDRLKEYISMVQNSNVGNLSFELEHDEKKWTKNDLFNYL